MPQTGSCRPNGCLHDLLWVTRMLIKFMHVPEWISACAGKCTSRTSLFSEEQKTRDSDRLALPKVSFPVPQAPQLLQLAAMHDSLGGRASPVHLQCHLPSRDILLIDLQGYSACLPSMCFNVFFFPQMGCIFTRKEVEHIPATPCSV